MSGRLEIASVNRGLLSREVLGRSVTPAHKQIAQKLREYFRYARKNPYKLSAGQLKALSEEDTIDYFISPVLEILGFCFRKKLSNSERRFPDLWLFKDEPESTAPERLQESNLTILEAKAWAVDLDKGDGRTETPPEQISRYISSNTSFNPAKKYGILSNGRKWRLYSGVDANKFIEFDFDVALLYSLEELELFAALFSPRSFQVDATKAAPLDRLRDQSLDSWVRVTTEIQNRGNDVLLALLNGFVSEGLNLAAARPLAFNLLYQLLYVLFVEAKNAIPTGSAYLGKHSLKFVLHNLYRIDWDEYAISERLTGLFRLLKKGNEFLPPAFGGELFEDEAVLKMKNKHLRSALESLAVFERDGIECKVFDYSSLNVELIGNIYEGTLNLEFAEKNGRVIIKRQKAMRGTASHSTGTTYTPPPVVKYLVAETLGEKIIGLPTVCDPACGSGHFLVQALRHLCERTDLSTSGSDSFDAHRAIVASQCIFGTDKNPLASRLARLMLVIETVQKGQPAKDFRGNIKQFDALLTNWSTSQSWILSFESLPKKKRNGFDFVLGNPPYVRADEPGLLNYRKQIKESGQYKWLHKKWDLFVPFIELAIGLTRGSKGSVGFVVGDGITYAPYAEVATKEISATKHLSFVSHFEEPFDGWTFPAVCFVYEWGNTHAYGERRLHKNNDPGQLLMGSEEENAFWAGSKKGAAKVREKWKGQFLGDYVYLSKGMVLHRDEGCEEEVADFSKEDLIVTRAAPDARHPMLYLDNDDLGPGMVVSNERRFIEYGARTRVPHFVSRPTFPELHSGPRILVASSILGRAAVFIEVDAIVSHNTIVIKLWHDLQGCSNRSLNKKIGQYCTRNGIEELEDGRSELEEASKRVSLEYLTGILISDFLRRWAQTDKRHKHTLVPDVLSEMPIPVPKRRFEGPDVKASYFGLGFQTKLQKLVRDKSDEGMAAIVYHVEQLVKVIRRANADEISLLLSFLDAMVDVLFEKVSKISDAA